MIDSILQSGIAGLQKGLSAVSEKAEKITRAFLPESSEDPTDSLVGMKLDEFQVKASAKIIATAEELQDSVLDILA